jgi:hypothetical protein
MRHSPTAVCLTATEAVRSAADYPHAAYMSEYVPLLALAAPVLYAVHILLTALVLRLCGVSRREVARWALRQAGHRRIAELIRAARGPGAAP